MKKNYLDAALYAALLGSNQDVVASGKSSKKTSRKPSDATRFRDVNSKFLPLLANQLGNVSSRTVLDRCIERTNGISSVQYQRLLRKMILSLIHNFEFIKDCEDLELDAFVVAQNVIILNFHAKVKKDGLRSVFENSLREYESLLKEPIFTESELANAEYDTLEGTLTQDHQSEIFTFIENARSLLSRGKKDVKALPEFTD